MTASGLRASSTRLGSAVDFRTSLAMAARIWRLMLGSSGEETTRKKRWDGFPSRESKFTPGREMPRTNRGALMPLSLQWGMATPSPMAVLPSFSLWTSLS